MQKKEIIQKYFELLEGFKCEKTDFEPILHPNFTQTEYPNTLNKNGLEKWLLM